MPPLHSKASEQAGPSKKRNIVDYESDSSAEQFSSAKSKPGNGLNSVNSSVNGSAASPPARKKGKTQLVKGKDKDDGKRAKEAERLWETRRELPFHQCRKMILEEVLAHETTIVSPCSYVD
jgi:hypothetical protein